MVHPRLSDHVQRWNMQATIVQLLPGDHERRQHWGIPNCAVYNNLNCFCRGFMIRSKLVQTFPNLLVVLVSMCIVLDHVAVTLLVPMGHPMGWYPCWGCLTTLHDMWTREGTSVQGHLLFIWNRGIPTFLTFLIWKRTQGRKNREPEIYFMHSGSLIFSWRELKWMVIGPSCVQMNALALQTSMVKNLNNFMKSMLKLLNNFNNHICNIDMKRWENFRRLWRHRSCGLPS